MPLRTGQWYRFGENHPYAAKLEVRREKAINNILMKFDESNGSGQVVEVQSPPDSEANDIVNPPADQATGDASKRE